MYTGSQREEPGAFASPLHQVRDEGAACEGYGLQQPAGPYSGPASTQLPQERGSRRAQNRHVSLAQTLPPVRPSRGVVRTRTAFGGQLPGGCHGPACVMGSSLTITVALGTRAVPPASPNESQSMWTEREGGRIPRGKSGCYYHRTWARHWASPEMSTTSWLHPPTENLGSSFCSAQTPLKY